MADENKNEYAAQLQNFNGEQHKHFYIVIPQIYKVSLVFSLSIKKEFGDSFKVYLRFLSQKMKMVYLQLDK